MPTLINIQNLPKYTNNDECPYCSQGQYGIIYHNDHEEENQSYESLTTKFNQLKLDQAEELIWKSCHNDCQILNPSVNNLYYLKINGGSLQHQDKLLNWTTLDCSKCHSPICAYIYICHVNGDNESKEKENDNKKTTMETEDIWITACQIIEYFNYKKYKIYMIVPKANTMSSLYLMNASDQLGKYELNLGPAITRNGDCGDKISRLLYSMLSTSNLQKVAEPESYIQVEKALPLSSSLSSNSSGMTAFSTSTTTTNTSSYSYSSSLTSMATTNISLDYYSEDDLISTTPTCENFDFSSTIQYVDENREKLKCSSLGCLDCLLQQLEEVHVKLQVTLNYL